MDHMVLVCTARMPLDLSLLEFASVAHLRLCPVRLLRARLWCLEQSEGRGFTFQQLPSEDLISGILTAALSPTLIYTNRHSNSFIIHHNLGMGFWGRPSLPLSSRFSPSLPQTLRTDTQQNLQRQQTLPPAISTQILDASSDSSNFTEQVRVL